MSGVTNAARPGVPPLAAALGLRERKKQRTKDALIEAAFELFSRNGFDATTVEEIAEAVEISPRTFFRYFGTKEDCVLSMLDDQQAAMEQAFLDRPAHEPVLTALRHAMVAVARASETGSGFDPIRFACMRELARANPSVAAKSVQHGAEKMDTLAAAIGGRMGVDPAEDPRPHLVAAIVAATVPLAIRTWGAAEPDTPASQLVERAFRLIEKGVNYPARKA
jgi:AcrR family transcriptional regulator